MSIFRGTGGTGDSTTSSVVDAVTEQSTIATTKAQEAATSASNALTSETNAATSATTASTKANEANTAKTAAENAKTAAENARNAAQTAQTAAESARDTAQIHANTANNTYVQTVAGISTEVQSLASIKNAITSVNTIKPDVTTVSNISSDVTTVASDASDIGTVSSNISNVNNVGNNIANVNSVATNATNINTVASDGTDIGTVATNISNVNIVAGISSDVTTVVGLESKMDTVIADASDIGTVANNIGDVGTVAGNITAVQNASANATIATNKAAEASASASSAASSANSIQTLTAATGAAGTEASYNASTGVLTVPRGADGTDGTDGTDASVTAANVTGVLTGGTGISIASNGTITNDSPDQTVALTGAGGTSVSGTYPNFTITSSSTLTDAQIKTAYENNADTNAFTDAEKTKLLGIEASADVTDATNVTAAGALMDSEVTNLAQVKAFDSSDYATAAQGTLATNALPKAGGQMTGNITFSGSQTVDGRDLSVDGIKLDSIEAGATGDQTGAEIKTAYEAEADTNAFTDADHTKLDGLKGTLTHNYWDSMQWAQGANRALTTTLTQYGVTQFVKHSGDTYKTYVDLSVDLIHSSTSGTNDAYGHLAVTAPSPTGEPTINMGTCTTFSSGVSYIRAFSISGDWSEYFSPYIGISKNSDGSSPMSTPYMWYYNPYSNTTTVWVSLYTNAPSTGDTIYLHPFDWESSGTVINGETLTLDGSSDTGVNNRRDFKIYLGRFDSRVSYKFKAKENSSTDVVTLDTLRMSTTEYEA